MKLVKAAAVVAVVAGVGAAVAWRAGLIGPRRPGAFEESEAMFDDFFSQAEAEPESDADFLAFADAELEDEVEPRGVEDPLEMPDEVADALSDPEVPDADAATDLDAGISDAGIPDALSDPTVPAPEGPDAVVSDAVASEPVEDVEPVVVSGEGSHEALADGSQPEGFPIKGNVESMLYHEPGSGHYASTKAEVWFATAADAEAAGFRAPRSHKSAE